MPDTSSNPGLALPLMTASTSLAAAGVRIAEIVANPSSYDLPVKTRSVVNQGNSPCCVSTALAGAMEILNSSWPALAPMFQYHVTRFNNHGANSEGFLFLSSGLATLTRDGICRKDLHDYPFTSEGAAIKPTTEASADAKTRALGRPDDKARFSQWKGSSKTVWIREQLRANHPVVIGFQTPEGYPKSFLDQNLEWRNPDSPRRTLKGHCVLVTGYDDARQSFRIQDSQGDASFDHGRWWMGYLVVDSTVVQLVYKLNP